MMPSLLTLETPRLVLDLDRLERNCAVMRERCTGLGVALRPHLKTAKSVDVARIAMGGAPSGITVSTLKEAEHFANAGYRDILYAATIVRTKFAHAARIQKTGCDLILVTDSHDVVAAASGFAVAHNVVLSFLIEIDCGEHRSGLPAGSLIFPSQYLTHRHPDFWENPERFEPGRFTSERSAHRPRYAYYPFGGGPRSCIGSHFAMLELCLVVATVAQRYHLSLRPGPPIEPVSMVTLHPSRDILMTVEAR